jgi:glycosyltransferase involved in cell wall biosynthesis
VLELLHVPEEKTSVVYHGHSFDKRNETSLVSIRKPYLLYVGQRGGYKNFDLLLRAYAHSPKLGKIFSLICFGGGAFRPAEQMRIKELGLLSQDVMQVSGDDTFLEGLYRGAEAFIYPSLYEGFGIPLLEAMALSCPVVCSNASCFSEVVGGAAEFFDAGDEESIRTSIEKVVFSNEYKTACVQRGRERAKLFSWDRCAKETMQIYTNQIEI